MSDAVFALLDDASDLTSSERRSRRYTQYAGALHLYSGDDHHHFFTELQQALDAGLHTVTLFAYEFGHLLHGIGSKTDHTALGDKLIARVDEGPSDRPWITALLFKACDRLNSAEVDDWLIEASTSDAYAITGTRAMLSAQDFVQAVAKIHRYIEAGDTYQVNFTFPLRFTFTGDPVALYSALRKRQPVPYGALIALPDGSSVLSLSPELFVSHSQGKLTCRPMKGTAAASDDHALNAQRAQALREDEKERAENLMIVDLLRNDLGRIAQTGSVRVPDLFSVERFGAVLQMTSTIVADARTDITLSGVFEALYPCGSITGAPKRRSMQILHELERWPRHLYTGGIGWFDPPESNFPLGDFMLSVPIRTLLLDAPDHHHHRQGEMGIGAGIVYDSNAESEYQECLLKARFLTGLQSTFGLFETMRATARGCELLDQHLARMASSAQIFGFSFDLDEVRRCITAECAEISDDQEYRLRLSLNVNGEIQLSKALVIPLQQPTRVLLSPIVMRSDDLLLAHKTTLRHVYDEGWKHAEALGAFDTLFFNERGELTEGGRTNVFIKLNGQWMTPPLSAGVLPGVMRAQILEDNNWNAIEHTITRADLKTAEAVCICNALRGVLQAQVVWND
jgi:para-aminobenzoate synthetase / 4-amino-4-deoxychorismate lyase